jgi:hypothetical protein
LTNVAGGGTLPAGTAGGIVYYTSTSAVASTIQLPAFAIVLGGGGALTPTTVSGLGLPGQLLTSNGPATPPTWQAAPVSTVAAGSLSISAGAIGSATCSAAQTASATGVATTDVVEASFNGDPTLITGFIPATTGMLAIIPYPTLNTVNFKICNNTSASITPGTFTLNWRVAR